MVNIDWHQLEKNAENSPQEFYENFNYQIAVKKYSLYGRFEYYYNTPGSEFYLILTRNCDELLAKAGEIIGWQAKFWFNKSDPDNSPLDVKHRNELIEGFKKSLEYRPELKVRIICSPGFFSNTAPHYPVKKLEEEIRKIKSDIIILYWQKPNYEAIFHSDPERFASIFNHYFSEQYLGFQVFKDHSNKRLDILRKRYDTDLYTPGKTDKRILALIYYKDLIPELHNKIKHVLEDREKLINSYLYKEVIKKFLNKKDDYKVTDEDEETIRRLKELIDNFLDVLGKLHIYNEKENILGFVKELFNIIEGQREGINKLIHRTGFGDRLHYDIYIDYNSDVEEVYVLINYLYSIVRSFLNKTIEIHRLLFHVKRQFFNIFSEAGFGKTNFACFITEQLLSKGHPVLLIPSSEIRGTGESIEKQILSFLDIESSISFKEFIGILDSLGFQHRKIGRAHV